MRSKSVNVVSITFGEFTLPSHFPQLFEAFTPAQNRRRVAFNSPQSSKLYTKATPKANPPERPGNNGTVPRKGRI
jgi:hypothetical protein